MYIVPAIISLNIKENIIVTSFQIISNLLKVGVVNGKNELSVAKTTLIS